MTGPLATTSLSVALVMPAYNEADGISEFLDDLISQIHPMVRELTVVVVDDHSTDSTEERIVAYAKSAPCVVECVRWPTNRGHGPTSLSAYMEALATDADVILHVDGDGQFDGADVAAVLQEIARGAEAVLGIRYSRTDPWFRKTLTRLVRLYLRLAYGLKVQDPNCPLRAYRRDALERIISFVPRDTLIPTLYLSILTQRLVAPVVELPVRSRPRRGGEETGTMWGGARSNLIPSKRLVLFVKDALIESLTTLPHLPRSIDPPDGAGTSESIPA